MPAWKLNAVSKFFSLVAALSSFFIASHAQATAWWQVPSQWPLAQPLSQLDAEVRQGWQVLQCQHSATVQLWLPEHGHGVAPLLRHFAAWPQHPMARFVPCFHLRWYQPSEVQCQHRGERQRLHCELPLLPAEHKRTRIVFAEQGIASAHGDYQINLPLGAHMNLLAHELAHWYGLADEYPLLGTIATDYCDGRYDHPSLNVVVTTKEQLSSAELKTLWQSLPWQFAVADWRQLGRPLGSDRWQLGSAENSVGLHAIDTCKAAGKFAWRPVDFYTAMHYVDVYSWPELYLQLMERQLRIE